MTLKVKRKKKKLKKEGERRGNEDRRVGECVGAEREKRKRGKRKEKKRGGKEDRREPCGRTWMLEGEIKLVSFTSHFCPLPLNRVKDPLKNEELGLSSKNP